MENNVQNNTQYDDEIDLRELFSILWSGKLKIIIITAIFAIASVLYALYLPNQYKVTTLLAPTQSDSSGISGALGSLGGLASIAGVSIPGGETKEMDVAQEIMISWSFIEQFIAENSIEVELFAAKDWDKESNTLEIDSDIFDIDNKKWLIEEPTSWQLFKAFSGLLSIRKIKKQASISFYRILFPTLLKWLDAYISAINKHMQLRQMSKVSSKLIISRLD